MLSTQNTHGADEREKPADLRPAWLSGIASARINNPGSYGGEGEASQHHEDFFSVLLSHYDSVPRKDIQIHK